MRRAAGAILVLVLAAGCFQAADEGTAEPETTTVAPSPTSPPAATEAPTSTVITTTTVVSTTAAAVEVVEDLVYHPGSGRVEEALLDVVVFRGAGASRHDYRDLAVAFTERGAVVFVPDWDKGRPFTGSTRDDLVDYVDRSACAVSYAVAHAAEYGADPETLVLFGHSAGAMVASVVALREAAPLLGCAVEMTPFAADGMVLWEGDWLLIHPGWDRHGESLPSVMKEITPGSGWPPALRCPSN